MGSTLLFLLYINGVTELITKDCALSLYADDNLLERHVQAYLLDWVSTESLILDDQWGFLSGRSTTVALVNTVDKWHRCLERGNKVCVVFSILTKPSKRFPITHCWISSVP